MKTQWTTHAASFMFEKKHRRSTELEVMRVQTSTGGYYGIVNLAAAVITNLLVHRV